MELNIAKDIDELNEQFALWMIPFIEKKLKQQKQFTLVLSGGNTPKKLFQLLASERFINKIDWEKIHFFWGDERCVPFTDERNNAKMAFDNLLDHVPAVYNNIHMMRTDIEPAAAAAEYERLLHEYFPHGQHTFDMVLLGMGDDAHTLSLFPGFKEVLEKKQWVSSFFLEEQEMFRITLTAPVVNLSGCVVFLVSGESKAMALQHVLQGEYEPVKYPSQVIQPADGELYWWVDEKAAKNLK